MARSLLVLAVSLSVASSTLLSPIQLDKDTIQYLAVNTNQNLASTNCIDTNFKYCQARFNEHIGLDGSVDWTQADVLLKQVQTYADANVTELLTLCASRAQFYQCLGAQYRTCVSLYNLLSRPGMTSELSYTYVDMYTSLDFICNAGFEEAVNQYSCLQTLDQLSSYQTCINNFKTAIAGHPELLCDSANTAGLCLNDAYASACQHDTRGAGWFGCEDFLTSFEDTCYERTRCYVH